MKNSEKTVITVFGSEDGIIGVATNKKEAWKMASAYLRNNDLTQEEDFYTEEQFMESCKPLNYNKMCRESKGQWLTTSIYRKDGVHANLSEFYLNNF